MPGRNRDQAVEAFLAPLRLAVSCVTQAILVRRRSQSGQSYVTLSSTPAPVGAEHQLSLSILHAYDVVSDGGPAPRWAARTSGYAYELGDSESKMILAYHWHPLSRSWVAPPHLHVGGTIRSIDLGKAHLPTGLVTLQQVLLFAVVDLGVRPLRPDWQGILTPPARSAEA